MINWEEFGAGWRLKPLPVKEKIGGRFDSCDCKITIGLQLDG